MLTTPELIRLAKGPRVRVRRLRRAQRELQRLREENRRMAQLLKSFLGDVPFRVYLRGIRDGR